MLRFWVRPFIRHVRNTEGGPILMLRFEVRPVKILILELHREDYFILYCIFRSAKNFIMVLQRVGHFLYCALRTDRIFILELCREDGPFLILRFKVRPKFYFSTTDGGPFLILLLWSALGLLY